MVRLNQQKIKKKIMIKIILNIKKTITGTKNIKKKIEDRDQDLMIDITKNKIIIIIINMLKNLNIK